MEVDNLPIRLPAKVYGAIEQHVLKLYQRHHIATIPIDPFAIAQNDGHVLKAFSSLDPFVQSVFRTAGLEAVNFYDPTRNARVIAYDDSVDVLRTRFTIMHELGHLELGHREESDLAKKMADYFAAYALAPSPLIGLFKCEDYLDVADVFQISSQSADYCFQRFLKWCQFGGKVKPYEKELVNLFRE